MSANQKQPSLKLHLIAGIIVGVGVGVLFIRGLENALDTGFSLAHYSEALLGIFPGLVIGGLTFAIHKFIANRRAGSSDTV